MNGHMQLYWLQSKPSIYEFEFQTLKATNTHTYTYKQTDQQKDRVMLMSYSSCHAFHPPLSIFYARLQLDSLLTHEYEDKILTKIGRCAISKTNERATLLQQYQCTSTWSEIRLHGNEFETKHLILHSMRVIERLP